MALSSTDRKDIIREGLFRVEVPASTSNLGPGFDCMGLALSLKLTFEAEVGTPETSVSRPEDPFGESIPLSKDLLVIGFRRALEMWGINPPEVRFVVRRQPPIRRGLGSSAAAIVGGVALAEALMWAPVGRREVARVAFSIEGHPPSVCASAIGGLVITSSTSTGRILVKDLNIHPMWKIAVAVPEIPEQPEMANKVLPDEVPLESAVSNIGRSLLLIHALMFGDAGPFQELTEDLLHQPFRAKLIPGFNEVKRAALEAGAAGVFISGSGSSIAAFVSENPDQVAKAMVLGFEKQGVKAVPLSLSVDRRGYQVTRV